MDKAKGSFFQRVEIARDRPVKVYLIGAPVFRNSDHRGILIDIQSDITTHRLQLVVSVFGWFGCCLPFCPSLAVLPFAG